METNDMKHYCHYQYSLNALDRSMKEMLQMEYAIFQGLGNVLLTWQGLYLKYVMTKVTKIKLVWIVTMLPLLMLWYTSYIVLNHIKSHSQRKFDRVF